MCLQLEEMDFYQLRLMLRIVKHLDPAFRDREMSLLAKKSASILNTKVDSLAPQQLCWFVSSPDDDGAAAAAEGGEGLLQLYIHPRRCCCCSSLFPVARLIVFIAAFPPPVLCVCLCFAAAASLVLLSGGVWTPRRNTSC